jgi:hypothetical protein
MTYERLKEISNSLFILLVVFSCLGAFIYFIYKNRDITPPPKNQLWCASVIYFSQNKHSFDTIYSKSTVFGEDSIVNFTDQYNQIWWTKDFVSNEERYDDDKVEYHDITLKNGERFKITAVSEGDCQSKAIEDSLKEDLKPSDYDSNDN